MDASTWARLVAARIDGRAENIRYRQEQLRQLHSNIVTNRSQLHRSLLKDAGYTKAESDVELAVAMNAIRHHYDSLDFDVSIKQEYSVARGHDYAHRMVGVGIVYIKPADSSSLYAIIAPLSAAIAAGNAVILKLGEDSRYLTSALRRIFQDLDEDTFAIVQDLTEARMLREVLVVEQGTSPSDEDQKYSILGSLADRKVVAVVDRTADIEQAALALVDARFGFNGRSAYAPDLVLVNEYVQKAFLEALARHAISYAADGVGDGITTSPTGHKRLLDEIDADSSIDVTARVKRGCIVSIKTTDSAFMRRKVDGPALLVAPMTSLDDAIRLVNGTATTSSPVGKPANLASYVFAQPATAKYLSQFIDAQASFVNHIPAQLLVGPAAPFSLSQALSVELRYLPLMFQVPRPQFAVQSPSSGHLARVLRGENGKELTKSVIEAPFQPLTSTRQALQMAKVGFFEQGILIGLTIVGSPILIALGTGTYYFGGYCIRRFFQFN